MYLNGNGIAGKDARGGTITDDHFLLYFNADGPAEITLPPEEYAAAWDVVINTGGSADAAETCHAGSSFHMESTSLLVLREYHEPEGEPDHSVAASVAAQTRVG
jgi:glycogen operon protein